MKEDKLIKNIETQVKKFKQRTWKSPDDEKRHDPIRQDEQKHMWIAYDQLGWSYAKIGSVFDRDRRTVKDHVEKECRRRERQIRETQHDERDSLQQKQKEHIRVIQQMAMSALDQLPDFPNLIKEPEAFESFNDAIVKVYRRLTGNVDWESMSEHLGSQGKEIEAMSSILDDLLPRSSLTRPKLDNYKENLEKAWFLIQTSGLGTISESSDTRKWEWEGMNQRCRNCPDQRYEPVDISP
ncbi:hypothetical protein ACFLWZ_04935 [Chloroflexota bacterium]